MMGLVGENEIRVGTRFLGRRAPQMSGRTCPERPEAQMMGLVGEGGGIPRTTSRSRN